MDRVVRLVTRKPMLGEPVRKPQINNGNGGSTPMLDIAIEVGFENASHFSRVFRQTFGLPPNKIRSTAPN
ncbi:helix-turn-helix domain-containing protein [Mesorhizobium sp. VK25A]|uniref:Helix-turn-helix domain-containing protein n=1 Tax=Mesorhizobium vachelliae TaxID=3072309 RepID=A0ABU5A5X4_9HYPH|nr:MULTISPECIES: helix-turn-helix domain-containing protein [unclassified Mesorhizobium]MDX8533104.1 helix-turn-helix domain-containing protein [Mesorhizobium sp. VK25D]MDX8545023.1 helix-turn-helix domain-containing protein [Mesorhizobium sp. VK25A]